MTSYIQIFIACSHVWFAINPWISLSMYCNYAHRLQYYYPLACTWLITGLFTDMTERGSHQMLIGRLEQNCGLLFKEDSVVYLCTQHICIFTRGYWQSTLGANSFAHVRGNWIKTVNKNHKRWTESMDELKHDTGWILGLYYRPHVTSNNINTLGRIWWDCLWWAPGARIHPNPSFLFNRLCWQWERRYVAAGQVDDAALMDVAAMTRGKQLSTAIRITADNVTCPPDLSGEQHFHQLTTLSVHFVPGDDLMLRGTRC